MFGVPDGQDREFFLKAGLELGETLKIGSPKSTTQYVMRQDGGYYGAHLEKVFQQRREAALNCIASMANGDDHYRAKGEKPPAPCHWLWSRCIYTAINDNSRDLIEIRI